MIGIGMILSSVCLSIPLSVMLCIVVKYIKVPEHRTRKSEHDLKAFNPRHRPWALKLPNPKICKFKIKFLCPE